MAYSFEPPVQSVEEVPAIVAGNRLEPRPRTAEFNRSLRAEVRDAAWLLARQWQMKEFKAEDRGSPIASSIAMEFAPLNQFKIGNHPIIHYPSGELPQPLDVLVQAQPPVVDEGMRLQMGNQWVRILRYRAQHNTQHDFSATQITTLLTRFRQYYGFVLPMDLEDSSPNTSLLQYAQARTSREAYTLLQTYGPTAFDGYRLLQRVSTFASQTDYDTFLFEIGMTSSNTPEGILIGQVIDEFTAWYRRVYFQHELFSQHLAAWSVRELAYQFQAAAPSSAGPVVLEAREHLGDTLDWYTMDKIDPSTAPGFTTAGPVKTLTTHTVPNEIEFAGSPTARWWDFEDRKVDFGQLTGDASDMGRMLLQDFMFLYHNDWFSVPYTLPMGSLCTVQQLTITDVFGLRYVIKPAGDNPAIDVSGTAIDDDWGRWSLFALSQRGNRQVSRPQVLLPPTAIGTQVGPVLEQVYLAREEATNLVWGVEQIIPDQLGRGMDGHAAAAQVSEYLRTRAQPVTPLATAAQLQYRLSTPTTENWIPFVPRREGTLSQSTSYLALAQGEMLRQVEGLQLNVADQTVKPRTSLLKYPEDVAYLIHERQVPPVGVRLEGSYRRARWHDGTILTWYSRSRGNGRAVGSSGLAYDQLLPREARTTPTYFAVTGVRFVSTTTPVAGDGAQLRAADGVPLIERIFLKETDAAGTLLPATLNTVLDITRAQLVRLLDNGDQFYIVNTREAVGLVTVGTARYVKRNPPATGATVGDYIGAIP